MVGWNDAHQAATPTTAASTASASCNRRCAASVCAPASAAPAATPAKTKPAHGTSVKLVWPGVGRQYHCSGAGSTSIHAAVRMSGAAIAIATVAAVAARTWPRAARAGAPQQPAGHQRQAHHVEDVDLQEVDRRSPAQGQGLQPEHEGQAEDDPAAARQGQRGLEPGGAGPPFRRARERRAESGEEQERRRGQPADEDHPVERGPIAIGVARPGVDDVGEHHRDHGDTTGPVEPGHPPRTWRTGSVRARPRTTS